MSRPARPPNESQRVAALRRYEVIDTPAERAFDDLALLASHICQTPIAAVTLIDAERQWLKAKIGLDRNETSRDAAFCAHTILEPAAVLEIPDATRDARFAHNPYVVGDPHIRFYAGAPIVTPDSHAIGSVCVIDRAPRRLTAEQHAALQALARQAVALLEVRRSARERSEAVGALDRFFSLSLDMLCIASTDGRFIRLNPAFSQILGWSEEELLAQPFISLVHPQDRERTLAEMQRLQSGAATLDFLNRYRCRDGSYRWFAWKSAPSAVDGLLYASARDVTDQIYIEEEMQRSEERFRMVVEAAPSAMVMVDEAGLIRLVNSEAEHLFDYRREEMLGRPVDMLFPNRLRSQARQRFLDQLAARMASGQEVHARRKHGVELPIEISVSPLLTAEGQFVLASIIDITERRRIERMKSEFLSIVSHELRTPLTSIRGSLGLMQGGAAGEMPAKAKQLVDLAWRNTDRLAVLINDILDFEKIESGQIRLDLAQHSIRELVHDAISANAGYAQTCAVRYELVRDAADAQVTVDSGRILQVLANLLSNAAKFSPEGMAVHIAIERKADRVRVSVRDRGPGVPADFQARVFQKFSQADSSDRRRKGGAGLGLAISKALIERMDGVIGFDSTPGQGAAFWFELPLAAASP